MMSSALYCLYFRKYQLKVIYIGELKTKTMFEVEES